jgi:glycosyltransferase involved in cell wall biosynthesis
VKGGNQIVILCSRLDLPGGIERAIVNLANLLVEKGKQVSILVLDETDQTYYPLDARVKVVQHPLSFGISKQGNVISRKIRMLSDVIKLRRALRSLHPGTIIATEYPFASAAILSGARKYAKIYSWEHHHFHELKKSWFWENLSKQTYPKLDGIVCLNEDEKKLFSGMNPTGIVIPNFVEAHATSTLNNKLILTVGRLTEVKGTDVLLNVAKEVFTRHPEWNWKLIGDGEIKHFVTAFIKENDLDGRLILQTPPGHDIFNEYRQASIYVMTSRFECLPMTIMEAQSCGLPVVAFDCETGPRHLIQQNENGILVPPFDTDKMANAISMLITNEIRKKMGENAFQNIKKYDREKIFEMWEKEIL